MKKSRLLLIGIILTGLGLGLVWARQNKSANQTVPTSDSKLRVSVSFYPLAEFTRQVGQELVQVESIVPMGIEPHDFEPSVQDLEKIGQSKLLIYNGNGLEPWIEKVSQEAETSGVRVLNMTQALDLGQTKDPHIWLDPILAQQEVLAIQDQLTELDPEHKEQYQQNTIRYIQKLLILDQKYQDQLADCQLSVFVTSHQAFGYLAKRYNLKMINIAGLSPENEPSAKELAEIAKMVDQNQIPVVFFESLASPRLAELIASETGAKTEVLDPIEGISKSDQAKGLDYLTQMESNLTKLTEALACQ